MSRFKTLNALFNSPLSVSRSAASGLKFTLSLMMELQGFNVDKLKERGFLRSQNSGRPTTDWDGEPIAQMSVQNGIAIIPVKGTMMMDIPSWAKEMGYVDVDDVITDISQAIAQGVRGLLFDYDSPGGATMAGHKLFDAVSAVAAVMPVKSFASGDMGSAAYQAALPSHTITATPYSQVGSVGTYTVIVDDSDYFEKIGISFEVIASGKFKGMGIVSLTDSQRDFLTSRVNALGDQFRANVIALRPGVDRSDMEGQYYDGAEAAARGFIDGTEKTLQNALASFSEMIDNETVA